MNLPSSNCDLIFRDTIINWMEGIPTSETSSRSNDQEIPSILLNPNFTHRIWPLLTIIRQANQTHIATPYLEVAAFIL